MFEMDTVKKTGKSPRFTVMESPVGPLTLVASGGALVGLLFENTTVRGGRIGEALKENPSCPVLVETVRQLREYFSGARKVFDVPLELHGTPFQETVWEVLREIPYGARITYGEVAARAGDVRKARPVGGAVGRNPVGIIVPCHRVVGSNGTLTGFGGGLDVKAYLLDLEAS